MGSQRVEAGRIRDSATTGELMAAHRTLRRVSKSSISRDHCHDRCIDSARWTFVDK